MNDSDTADKAGSVNDVWSTLKKSSWHAHWHMSAAWMANF